MGWDLALAARRLNRVSQELLNYFFTQTLEITSMKLQVATGDEE